MWGFRSAGGGGLLLSWGGGLGAAAAAGGVKEFDGASVPGSLNLGGLTGGLKFREFPDLRA